MRFGLARPGRPVEMTFPKLAARVKERHNLSAQVTGQIWAFGQIALGTSKAQIVDLVAAAMLLSDNVLDVKCGEVCIVLMQPAILAPSASHFPNACAKGGVHYLSAAWERCWRAFDFKSATKVLKLT
jgi:hypothetical protein